MNCKSCGGPCRAYAGDVHGWTCRTCLQCYIDKQADPPAKRIAQQDKRIHEGETDDRTTRTRSA